MRDDFTVFICTHGRPDRQHTYNALHKCGYTGKIILVLDNTDSTIQQYIDNYGVDMIMVFNKNYYINSQQYDNGDNEPHFKCILYAKRAVEDIAKSMDLKHFVIADDDITNFAIRYPKDGKLKTIQITDFDKVVDAYVEMLKPQVACVGFGYAKSYFRGINTFDYKELCLRPMPYQFLFRNGDIEVNWQSWFAEDDITELQSSLVGNLWLSLPHVMQIMKTIGDTTATGGMVDTYKQYSEFKLKFNIVKYCPQRAHFIQKKGKLFLAKKSNNCFPKLISDTYRKDRKDATD